jgi:prophage regulatory protein
MYCKTEIFVIIYFNYYSVVGRVETTLPIPLMENSKMSQIIRLPRVSQITQLSRSKIYNLMAADDFPQKIQLGVRAIGFLEAEILEWIQARADARLIKTEDAAPAIKKARIYQKTNRVKSKCRANKAEA